VSIVYIKYLYSIKHCLEGIAKKPITDWDGYRVSLKKRMEKYWNQGGDVDLYPEVISKK
jgi:hypothetical protein